MHLLSSIASYASQYEPLSPSSLYSRLQDGGKACWFWWAILVDAMQSITSFWVHESSWPTYNASAVIYTMKNIQCPLSKLCSITESISNAAVDPTTNNVPFICSPAFSSPYNMMDRSERAWSLLSYASFVAFVFSSSKFLLTLASTKFCFCYSHLRKALELLALTFYKRLDGRVLSLTRFLILEEHYGKAFDGSDLSGWPRWSIKCISWTRGWEQGGTQYQCGGRRCECGWKMWMMSQNLLYW